MVFSTFHFKSHWLAEVFRSLFQQNAVLPYDGLAVSRAQRCGGDVSQQMLTWAQQHARHSGWQLRQQQWQSHQRWVNIVIVLLALCLGFIGSYSVLGNGNGRSVNVVLALGGVLGMHLISVMLWGLSLFFRPNMTLIGRLSEALDKVLYKLTAKEMECGQQTMQIGRAWTVCAAESGGLRWYLGALTHAFWTLFFIGVLAGMLFFLSLQRYDFQWETTLLTPAVFKSFVQGSALLPSYVGFPLPSDEVIDAGGGLLPLSQEQRSIWAQWLVGCVLVYGLLLRMILWGVCLWRWLRRTAALRLNLYDPFYVRLAAQLRPVAQPPGVIDAAPRTISGADRVNPVLTDKAMAAPAMVCIEYLSPALAPLRNAVDGLSDYGVLADRTARYRILNALHDAPPVRLLLACTASLSPDRGTQRLLSELASVAHDSGVLLTEQEEASVERLEDWARLLSQLGLAEHKRFVRVDDALAWLESGAPL